MGAGAAGGDGLGGRRLGLGAALVAEGLGLDPGAVAVGASHCLGRGVVAAVAGPGVAEGVLLAGLLILLNLLLLILLLGMVAVNPGRLVDGYCCRLKGHFVSAHVV